MSKAAGRTRAPHHRKGHQGKGHQANNRVWKALADPTRRSLLDLLKERPRTTGELCARFKGVSRFAVMKHLNLLEETRLVVARREGRLRWNHLNAEPIREIDHRWIRHYRMESK